MLFAGASLPLLLPQGASSHFSASPSPRHSAHSNAAASPERCEAEAPLRRSALDRLVGIVGGWVEFYAGARRWVGLVVKNYIGDSVKVWDPETKMHALTLVILML